MIRPMCNEHAATDVSNSTLQDHPWYRKGLPSNVIKMNDECLLLKPHNHPGYQTIAVRTCAIAYSSFTPELCMRRALHIITASGT